MIPKCLQSKSFKVTTKCLRPLTSKAKQEACSLALEIVGELAFVLISRAPGGSQDLILGPLAFAKVTTCESVCLSMHVQYVCVCLWVTQAVCSTCGRIRLCVCVSMGHGTLCAVGGLTTLETLCYGSVRDLLWVFGEL